MLSKKINPRVSPVFRELRESARKDFAISKFTGRQRDFPALMDHLRNTFNREGIGNMLGPLADRPVIEAEFVVGQHRPHGYVGSKETYIAEQTTFKMKKDDRRTKIQGQYEKATALVLKVLGGKALSTANKINRVMHETMQIKFNKIFDRMTTKNTQRLDVVSLELHDNFEKAPIAHNVDEALILLDYFEDTNMDLAFFDPAKELTDSALRFHLMKHLDPVVFKDFIMDMQEKPNHPAWTFEETSDQLDKMSECERVLRMNTSPDTVDPPAFDPGAATSMVNFSKNTRGENTCDNCGGTDHFAQNCPHLCSCGVKPLHHGNNCLDRSRRGTPQGSPATPVTGKRGYGKGAGRGDYRRDNGGRGDSRGRGGGRGDGRSRGGDSLHDKVVRGYHDQKRQRQSYEVQAEVTDNDLFSYDETDPYADYDEEEEDEYDYQSSRVNMVATVQLEHQLTNAARQVDILLPQASVFDTVITSAALYPPLVLGAMAVPLCGSKSHFDTITTACLQKIKTAHAIDRKARTRHATLWRYPVSTSVFTTSLSTLSVDLSMTPADVWHRTATARYTRWITQRQQEDAEALLKTRRAAWHVRRRRRSDSRSHCVALVPYAEIPASPPCYDTLAVRTPHWISPGPRRPYLAMAKFYRSSVRGRGRDYTPPWWMHATATASTSTCRAVTIAVTAESSSPKVKAFLALTWSTDRDSPSPGPSEATPALAILTSATEELGPHQPLSEAPRAARCYHITLESTQIKSLLMGMLDTGANLPITHPVLADILGITPELWPTPIPIKFGNNTNCVSTLFIDLGPLIGRMALVDSAKTTILTKHALHQQGLSVWFRADNMCQLLDSQHRVVYESLLTSTDDFFLIPLATLLPAHLRRRLIAYAESTVSASVNGRHARPTVTAAEVAAVMDLHERMYHPSSAVMARALRTGAWLGVDLEPTTVERVFAHQDCLYCALAKMKRNPRPHGSSLMPAFGSEISMDYLPVTTTARGGYTGAYIFSERSQSYAWAYLISRPSNNKLLYQAICYVRSSLRRYGFQLKTVRSDAGKVEGAQLLNLKLAELGDGVVLTSAAPEAQFQNPVERFIQTAARGIAATLLSQRFLDNTFWGMALLAWVRAWNCRPNESSGQYSPEYALTGHHPDVMVQFRYPFGACVASRSLTTKKTKHSAPAFKFSPTGELGFVVGNTVSTNGASLVFFPTKAHHMAFPRLDLQLIRTGAAPSTALQIEKHLANVSVTDTDGLSLPEPTLISYAPMTTQPPVQSSPSSVADGIDFTTMVTEDRPLDVITASTTPTLDAPPDTSDDLSPPTSATVPSPAPLTPVHEVDDLAPVQEGGVLSPVLESPSLTPGQEELIETPLVEDAPEPLLSPPGDETTDSATPELDPPSNDGPPAGNTRSSSKRLFSAVSSRPTRPVSLDTPTVGRAMKSPEAAHWTTAIEAELLNLIKHGTGTVTPRHAIPTGAQILPVKVVLKLKRDTAGRPMKYKARLCVLGNLARKSVASVFAPTANDKSLKILMALASFLRLQVASIDVYGAFLYPTQTEEIYIALPPVITAGNAIYWKLNKTMYGLPSSPAAFYNHVSAHLLRQGYHRCASDPCFFWLRTNADVLLAVVHVDDFALASSSPSMIQDFVTAMETEYVVTVTQDVEHFLGLHITEWPDGSRLLSQPGLLKKLFEKHPHIAALQKFPSVPMATSFCDEVQSASALCDPHAFMELLGSLLYLVRTRPDISYAVNRLAMRAREATEKDLSALMRILAYLYDTQELGITLLPGNTDVLRLMAWSDASYATHSDGKSHSGYGFTFDGTDSGLFFSRSTKQSNVTLSSTEAELYAAVEAAKDTIWFRELLSEIGFPQTAPTTIWVDNASLITLASEFSGNHKRVKHFLVRLNFLIDQVNLGTIEFQWVHTDSNCVDGLTKPLGPIQQQPKRGLLLGAPTHP